MPLTQREQALVHAIGRRAGDLLEDLRLHVGLPTGGGGWESPALQETRERFADRLRALGATIQLVPGTPRPPWLWGGGGGGGAERDGVAPDGASRVIPPTLVASRPARGPAGAARVLIAGHLDTVHDPAGPFRALSVAPDGRTATGPGCVDMKGGLVIALAALEALEEAGVDAHWTVILNSDEETGSYHSEPALTAQARLHDLGLALEPAMTRGELAVRRGGSGQFMLEAFGRAAHVGRDFASGRSAVLALAHAITRAGALTDAPRGVCVNIGPLIGGSATNVVVDHARAWGNVRFPGPDEAASLEHGLRALEGPLTPGDDLPRVVMHTSLNRPAKPMTPPVERLALAARAAAEDLGQSLPFGETAGVCDGNILQAAGLPTIDTLGVRGGGLHTPQEWIELPSLAERCALLAVMVGRASAVLSTPGST